MTDPAPISATLRDLVTASTKPLKHLARDSGVSYRVLRYWFITPTATLDVDAAEAIYQTLTGKPFRRP